MNFYIYTLGCKVNAYESEVMKEKLLSHGFIYSETSPQIVIINTCSVTNMADVKSKKMVRHFKKNFPKSILVVCGCSSYHEQEDYQKLGIDILIGNTEKSKIVELINTFRETHQSYVSFVNTRALPFEDMEISQFTTHNRAYIKIQDGCDNFCSYCVIPMVRGSIRSKDFDTIIKEAKTLVKNGHKEIVLTGIHTGSYGVGTSHDLVDVIEELSKIDGLERIRTSSIEITELNEKFMNCLKNNPKLCNHMHIPLQAGSNEILSKMKRKYNLKEYADKLKEIRSIRPDMAIATDIIVGFPGETEDMFIETLKNARHFGYSKIHVFPYSKRTGTAAALMPDQILECEKHERSKRLIALSKELETVYAQKFLGQEMAVLIETSGEVSTGCTSNYLKVKINQEMPRNEIVKVKLDHLDNDEIIGIIN